MVVAYQMIYSSKWDGTGSAAENWVPKRDFGQLDQQVPQDVLLSLDGEPLVVGIGVVEQLHVEVGPDASDHLSPEFEDAEGRFFRLPELQAMCEILSVLLLYQPLQVWQAALNSGVPEVFLAAEEPLPVIFPDLILY